MTRYTNLGRKRTFEQANINYRESEASDPVSQPSPENISEKPKSKRRRRDAEPSDNRASSTAGLSRSYATGANAENLSTTQAGSSRPEPSSEQPAQKKTHRAGKRVRDQAARKLASERRRVKRVDQRTADTVCYACREKGHAARDCRKTIETSTLDGQSERIGSQKTGKKAVGLCYRCGSRKHNLSRCQEPEDPSNPLPFASCFVCSGQGHLASSCPKNESKGIYPNGGCCKLCSETTHLAKDCPLRKKDVNASSAVLLGTGRDAGADEDDFHTLKRQTSELDKADKKEIQQKKRVNVRVGAHSGTLKAFGKPTMSKAKKVVYF